MKQPLILAIKTDQPVTELYLLGAQGEVLAEKVWEAGRQLSKTLLAEIQTLLKSQELQLTDLTGLVVFEGPGSFTGLRIGITTANSLAYSLNIPIAGSGSQNWLNQGFKSLDKAKPGQWVVPVYGAPPRITPPKK